MKEVISDYEKLDNPIEFPLFQALFAYNDLQEKQRRVWHPGALRKAG